MTQKDEQAGNVRFEELADRFTNELRGGRDPQIDCFAERHPEHATAIRRLFPVLQVMEQRGTPVEDLSESGLLEAEKTELEINPAIRMLGDYRIIREIGRGGMGIVFEAEQESLGRRVALKLLPDSAQFDNRRRLRFQQEAQASAKLQHPNIVNVFGIGEQDDTSYFVMQFIDGQPLNSVLKEVSRIRTGGLESTEAIANAEVATIVEALHRDAQDDITVTSAESGSPTETSNRFSSPRVTNSMNKSWWRNVAKVGVQVASALEHAHQNRTLHRDIKPANLMLDQTGNIWVTDFGLAKHFESTDLTRTGEVVGTLRYMSPEQLNGKSDERSDLFALGLTLYEMAALKPAYAATDRNDLMKQAIEANPPKLRTIDRQLPRDLETIIHKSIASEPRYRYQTATELKKDLYRLLNGEPVLARRVNVVERSIKWCRRRPVIATLCGALAVSLIAGIAGIAWQWQQTELALIKANDNLNEARIQNERADKHFREARESVDKFYTIISEERLLREPGFQPLRKDLMTEALQYYRNFSEQYSDDDSLQLEVGRSLLKLVQIEGSYSTDPKIMETCEEAIAVFEELTEIDSDNYAAWVELSEGYAYKGRLLRRRSLEGSLQPTLDSIAVLEKTIERFPDSSRARSKLAERCQMLGLAYESLDRSTGRTDRSLEHYSRSYALRKELAVQNPHNIRTCLNLAGSCRDLGITHRRMQKNKKAIEYYNEAVRILEPIVAQNPEDRDARRTLGSIANSIGFFYGNVNSELDLDKAIELYKLSEQQYEILSRQDPLVIEYQDGLGRAAMNLGSIYQHKQDFEMALKSRRKGMEIRKKVSNANPTAPHLKSNLGFAMNGVGSVLRDLDRVKEATEIQIEALACHHQAVKLDPGNPRFKYRLIDSHIQMARVQCAGNKFAEARDSINQIEQYTRPDDTLTVVKAAKEYLLVACKIGKIEKGNRSDEQESLRTELVAKSKEKFRKAAERGLDVLKWYADDTDMRYFIPLPEGQEMKDWLETGFASSDDQQD